MAFLEIKNLYKNFGETEVLRGINFTLERGEVLSILGSSGSGKTTLLRCLNSLEKADSGEILIDGTIVFPAKNNLPNSTFGLVFQNFNLFPQYTALENVVLALNVKSNAETKKKKLSQATKRAERQRNKEENFALADKLLNRMGLQGKENNYPCNLSGGQQQRVAIARALALSPEVLCFDEPTSALDPELTNEVLNAIRSLRKEQRTMIIVTHEIGFAKNVSDKIIFMADGIIEETGSPNELFKNPKREKLKTFLKKTEMKG